MLTLISLADVKMVSNLGKEAIAAVNLTNQPRFILLAVFNALNVGVTAIVSRKRGQGDKEGANRILRQILLLYALLAAVLSALSDGEKPLRLYSGGAIRGFRNTRTK